MIRKVPQVHSVLDVGCSHGRGVEMLWEAGRHASGMDIAPTAVRMALKHRHPPPGYCLDKCFQQGSAAAIPWPTKSFDAIMTTDVLEHIPEADVPTVAKEFARIARQAVYAKIATTAEGKHKPLNTLHANMKGGDFDKFHYLHETA